MEASNMTLGGEYTYKLGDRLDTVTFLGFVPLHSDCHLNPHGRIGSFCAVEDERGAVIMVHSEQLQMTAKHTAAVIVEKLSNSSPDPGSRPAAVGQAIEKLREERKLPPGPGRQNTI